MLPVAAVGDRAQQAGGTSSHYSEKTDAIIERARTCLEYRDPEGWRSLLARVPRFFSISKI
jgi:hypothetical protein